jgi:general secretion pathway protein D
MKFTSRTPARVLGLLGLIALAASLAQAQQRNTRSSSSGNYLNATQVGEAVISSDPETRKLIVVTDDETAQYIGQVITNLDRAAPQVLINVVFLEATYRKGLDLGVEGSYSKQNGDVTSSILQQFQGVSGLNSGAGIASFVGQDWSVTLRAIAENGKLEVLSRPTILARNNQEATITVGQQVPLITNVRYDNFGNQINAISYQDVGIILRVTPFITSDNLIEMIVSPEISNLSDEKVAIATGTNSVGAPVINLRSADTVVVTPDGQTVVIGGLMQDTKTETISKVPFFGDIPLLGAAFRRKVNQDTKTELLIFLTPRIVKHPRDLIAMTKAERANTVVLPQTFTEEQLNNALDGAPRQQPPPPKSKKKKS